MSSLDESRTAAAGARRIAYKLASHERRITDLETAPSLPFSSIDDGAIEIRSDGKLVGRIGAQQDGSFGAIPLDGPTPSAPQPEEIHALGGTALTVRFTPRVELQTDWAGIEFLTKPVGTTQDYQSIGAITARAGGSKSVAVPAGEYVVVARHLTFPGKKSEVTQAAAAVRVELPVSDGGMREFGVKLREQIEASAKEIAEAAAASKPSMGELESRINALRKEAIPASRISADSAGFNSAVVDQLWAEQLRVKLVNSSKIITGNMIADGAITAPKIVASEELSAKVAKFLELKAENISVGALDGITLRGNEMVGATVRTGEYELSSSEYYLDPEKSVWRKRNPGQEIYGIPGGVEISKKGISAWDNNNLQTLRIAPDQNVFVGDLMTWAPPYPGITIRNTYSESENTAGMSSIVLDGVRDSKVLTEAPYLGFTPGKGSILASGRSMANGHPLFLAGDPIVIPASGITFSSSADSLYRDLNWESALKGKLMSLFVKGKMLATDADFTSEGSITAQKDLVVKGNAAVQGALSTQAGINATGNVESRGWLISRGVPSTSAASNAFIDKWGVLYKTKSARKYKWCIRSAKKDGVDAANILKLEPRTWIDATYATAHARWAEDQAEGGLHTGKWDYAAEKPQRIPGLVAEEVIEAGLGLYASYGENGEVEGLQYDRLWTLLVPVLRETRAELEKTRAELVELRARVSALESVKEVG